MSCTCRVNLPTGARAVLEIEESTRYGVTTDRKSRSILFYAVNETDVKNIVWLRLLKLGLRRPFFYWKDCITDRE
jgi:hypothetical protein